MIREHSFQRESPRSLRGAFRVHAGFRVVGRGIALVMLALLAAGCGHIGANRAGAPARVVRPDADSDYDVLVGEFATSDRDIEGARDAFQRAVEKDPDSAYLHRRVALHSAQLGDTEGALEHALRAVELDPEDPGARMLLARLHAQRSDVAGVEAALTGEDGKPISPRAGLMLVSFLLENGQVEEAVVIATALRDEKPDDESAHMSLISALERSGNRPRAEAAILDALARFPDRAGLYGRLGKVRREDGDREGEIAAYELLLEREPEHYGTLAALGDALIQDQDYAAARAVYQRLHEQFPDEPNIARRLAWLDWQLDDPKSAEARLIAGLEQHPRDSGHAYMLGLVRIALGNPDGAYEALERIPAEHESYVEARLQMAAILEAAQEWPRALAIFEELRVLSPDRVIDFHAAGVRARTGDVAGGVALVQEHLDATPEDPEALYQMGLVHEIAGDQDEAMRWMRRTFERDPKNAHALNYVGYTMTERGGDLDEAEQLLKRALELKPDDGYITDSLGWLYYMRGKQALDGGRGPEGKRFLAKAVLQLERAARLSGGDPVISEHLGDVYLLLENKARALFFYEEAVEQVPRLDEQPQLMDKLEALRMELAERTSR